MHHLRTCPGQRDLSYGFGAHGSETSQLSHLRGSGRPPMPRTLESHWPAALLRGPTVTVHALVVGLGSIGQRHARNLRTLLGDELVLSALRSRPSGFVVTDQLDRSEQRPDADCDGGVFFDLDEALAGRPDIVVVSTPTSLHLRFVEAAVLAGSAVFVEKPISHDMDGVAELANLIVDRGATVAVGCQLRFHPSLIDLERLVRQGVPGQLITVDVEQAEYLPSYHPYEDYRSSYAARRDLGGGVLLTQIHELDYLQWLFGVPTRVFAMGGRIGNLEIDVEDSVSALLAQDFQGHPLAVRLHLDYLQRPPRRTCRVVGEDASIHVDLRNPSTTVTDNAGNIVQHDEYPEFSRSELFLKEMSEFLAAARGERSVTVDFAHAVDTLRTASAIRTSMETGQAQDLR